MLEHLSTFHSDLSYYEYPGGGHWFGQSVDWPPLFDFFKWHSIPQNKDVENVEFYTACPGISSRSRWVEIIQQEKQMGITSVNISRSIEERSFSGTTDNVRFLELDITDFEGNEPITIELDSLNGLELSIRTGQKNIILERNGNQWQEGEMPSASQKNPSRYGMFKYGMQHQMIFVYGTQGTPAETTLAYTKARYDAETWWYRANGSVQIVPDTLFDPSLEPDRSVVIYGNAGTNAAWEPLLGTSPVQVMADHVEVGDVSIAGENLAVCFVRPRPGSDKASVVVIGATGEEGWRTAISNRYFISGAGYPDLLVLSSEMLRSGTKGVRAAGFFGNDWSVENGEFSFQ